MVCRPSTLTFLYGETPQEATGFSPAELMIGRQTRRPLDELKQGWEQDWCCSESTVSYLQEMFENLTTSRELV